MSSEYENIKSVLEVRCHKLVDVEIFLKLLEVVKSNGEALQMLDQCRQDANVMMIAELCGLYSPGRPPHVFPAGLPV